MRIVTVDKADLLNKLQENRTQHKSDYTQARAKWEQEVSQALKDAWHASVGGDFKHVQNPINHLPKPESFIDSYDQAIATLEWEISDTVELDEDEFARYVLDNWSWRGRFAANSTQYLVS